MDISSILDTILSKHREKEMAEVLNKYLPQMQTELKNKFIHELKSTAYSLDFNEANTIVKNMKPYGEHWTLDAVKPLLIAQNITPSKYIQYYLVMNMCYNDYYKTAEKFGLRDNVDFYFSLARDFIEDPDAKPFKVERYFLD